MKHRQGRIAKVVVVLTVLALPGWGTSAASSIASSSTQPAGGHWTLDAGDLKLQVAASQWGMGFFDGQGQPLFQENGGTGAGPVGTLGLHLGPPPDGAGLVAVLPPMVDGQPAAPPARETGWARVTGMVSSQHDANGWRALLSTSSPLHQIEVTGRVAGDGTLAFEARAIPEVGVQAISVGFDSPADEQLFGFGERSNAVNQAGNTVEHYVGEGPYQDEEYGPITAVVPKWGIRWREDATYYPVPWLLSSKGYGVLIDNDELSYHRLRSSDANAWSMEVEAPNMRFRVFAGETPATVLDRFSRAVGRQPDTEAPWFLGPWVQSDTNQRIQSLFAADVPTSLTATYLHYLPCGDQQGQEQAQRDRTAELHAMGTAVHTYFNPMICTDYQPAFDQADAAGALIEDRLGQTYTFPYTTSTVFLVSQFDFSTPQGVAAYGQLTDEALSHGYDGWMEDFGEYTPLDAVARGDGATGTEFHNRYPREYHCGVAEATADAGIPLARFVRSGWTGSAACSPLVWGGDPGVEFGFDGLESSVYEALSMGTSGVGLWGSDIGGFFALGTSELSPELLDRWIAFGGLSVLMRNQKDNIAIPDISKGRPQIWDAEHLPIWRRYAKLHTQLYPYLQAAVDDYHATGMPVMRHHVLTHPDDPIAIAQDDQYMFGPDLLVAPVYEAGASRRQVYLPAGEWVEFWRAVDYIEATGDFVMRPDAQTVAGGRFITVAAPIEEIPIFVRAGAHIPMLPADVDTLADYGTGPDLVHLRDRQQATRLLTFPGGPTAGAGQPAGTSPLVASAPVRSLPATGQRDNLVLPLALCGGALAVTWLTQLRRRSTVPPR